MNRSINNYNLPLIVLKLLNKLKLLIKNILLANYLKYFKGYHYNYIIDYIY